MIGTPTYGQVIGDRGVPVAGLGAPLVSEFAAMEYAVALGMSTDAGKVYQSAGCWSCATGSRGCGSGWSLGRLSVWRAGRIADQTISPAARGSRACGSASGSGGALVFVGADRPTCRGGDGAVRPRGRARPDAARRPSVVTSTSMSTRSPTTAPSTSMASWIWPTRWILRTRSAPVRDSSQPVGTPSRWMCAARSLPVSWPADSSPSDFDTTDSQDGAGSVGGALRPPRPGTRGPVREHQVPDQRGTDPGLVQRRHAGDREAGDRPGRTDPCRGLRSTRTGSTTRTPWSTCTACSRTAPDQRKGATPTTSSPHADGGSTCSENTAPLCRRHHRAKTHSSWTYTVLDRGTYRWTTPNGIQLLRDHTGTHPPTAEP